MSVDYEAEYNNRARVPEHADIFARWEREGADYRKASPKAALGLKYGPSERQTIDIFPAADDGPDTPLALFIHGGWWRSLHPSSFSQMAKGPNANGVTVAVAGYDLCPNVSIADIIQQMRAAGLFLWRKHKKQFVVYGHSAGGHLTLMTLLTDWPALDAAAPTDLIKGGLSISGLYDLQPIRQCYLNDKLGMDEAEADRNSPLALLPASTAQMPPLVCAVGGAEKPAFLQQQHDFVTTWKARGGQVTAITVPERHHFDIVDQMAQPGAVLQTAMADLLRRGGVQ